jgi:hypothetical protein
VQGEVHYRRIVEALASNDDQAGFGSISVSARPFQTTTAWIVVRSATEIAIVQPDSWIVTTLIQE